MARITAFRIVLPQSSSVLPRSLFKTPDSRGGTWVKRLEEYTAVKIRH